jgi:2'-5' RNA ligase
MPASFFTLVLDADLERDIRQLWALLAEMGIGGTTHRHRPHITLGGFDIADPASCVDSLHRFCSQRQQLPIRFHHIGFFPEKSVLFLQPRMTWSLLALHRSMVEELGPVLGGSSTSPNFAIDQWTPHCTLADSVPPDLIGDATCLLQERWKMLKGYAVGIGMVVPPQTVDTFQCRFI